MQVWLDTIAAVISAEHLYCYIAVGGLPEVRLHGQDTGKGGEPFELFGSWLAGLPLEFDREQLRTADEDQVRETRFAASAVGGVIDSPTEQFRRTDNLPLELALRPWFGAVADDAAEHAALITALIKQLKISPSRGREGQPTARCP